MKERIAKCIALMLAIMLVVPLLPIGNGQIASAAVKPSISMTKKTIIGADASFTLNLLNTGKQVKKFTWYSLNKKVATVEATNDPKTGKVTTVGKGIAKIRCKVTYKSGKSIYLTCSVTVKIPATGVEITNAKDDENNNNRHIIAVGESYDFNRTLTPSNASDTIYWTFDKEGYATVKSNGTVTGVKPGFIRLTATASLTKEGAATSRVNDGINIEIVEKTVKVKSVQLSGANKLDITFDQAIASNTVLGTNGKLLESVVISSKIDANGISANALGALTGTLSADKKMLTIQAANIFNGNYGIYLSSDIKTADGIALSTYNENLEFTDKTAPYYLDYRVDDTGLIVTINFSEAMDFTNMQVSDAKVITSGQSVLPTTLAILNTKSNYTISTDKKSLKINLTNISPTDQNKMFSVVLANIKDLAGNSPSSYPHIMYFGTDTKPKAQAALISLVRSGYNTLTATFTRSIKTPGLVMLNNGETITGVVNQEDPTKVNYTLSTTSVLLTGTQVVSIGYWDSYNVLTTDNSNLLTPRSVNFTMDATIPVLTNSNFEIVTENGVDMYLLTLNYNKNVSLVSNSGVFIAKLITADNDISSGNLLSYTAIAKDTKVTIVLNSSQITNGTYTITIPEGFVLDAYMNKSLLNEVVVKKDAAVASKLSAPKAIIQSTEDPNIIYVTFDKKLDENTAQNVGNYSFTGTTITSAELIDNTISGATVKLTLLQGSVKITTVYPLTISGIKGYQDSYSVMDKYPVMIPLIENTAPTLLNVKYTYPTTITYTFDETITGNPSLKVYQNNVELPSTSLISGNTIIISLNTVPVINTLVQIVPTQYNVITDIANNAVSAVLTRNIYLTYQ